MPKKDQPEKPLPLIEGLDYTKECGLFVLTAHYLRKRGYCCGNGCRNCPYDKKGQLKPDNNQ